MTIFKRNLLIATGVYILFYLAPILANPFMTLNLLEAAVVGAFIFGGFYLSYIFIYILIKANLMNALKIL